jgi:hypothetical protein
LMHLVPLVHSALFNHESKGMRLYLLLLYQLDVPTFADVFLLLCSGWPIFFWRHSSRRGRLLGDLQTHTVTEYISTWVNSKASLCCKVRLQVGVESWPTVPPHPSHQCWPCSNQKRFAWWCCNAFAKTCEDADS